MLIKHFPSFCRKRFSKRLPTKFWILLQNCQEYSRNRISAFYLSSTQSLIMSSKFEVMDDACSQTFARKLVQYFSIFVPKIQAKSQNQMAVKACIFFFFSRILTTNANLNWTVRYVSYSTFSAWHLNLLWIQNMTMIVFTCTIQMFISVTLFRSKSTKDKNR